LEPHHRDALALEVEAERRLLHAATLLEQPGLAAYLRPHRALDRAERVQVLGLGAGAERPPRPPQRDVGVAPEVALLEVGVRGADVAQDRLQRAQVGAGLLRRAQVGLGDDLDQRYPGAVQVDARAPAPALVDRLAGVLFHVDARDPDRLRLGLRIDLDQQPAPARERLLVLGDLVALRK